MITIQDELLVNTVGVLKRCNIRYCLIFGTLLGAIRDNSLMSYDSLDIDIAIFSQPWKNDTLWHKFIVELHKLKYKIVEVRKNYMCIKPEFIDSHLHVDFYYFSSNEEMVYSYKGPHMEFLFNRTYFDELSSIEFLGTTMSIPMFPEEVLAVTYGGDWRTPKTADEMYSSGKPYYNMRPVTIQPSELISYTYVEPLYEADLL